MAATSIKVDAETKRALDKLQAHLTEHAQRKVTQQEITRILVEQAEQDPERLVAMFTDPWEGLSPAQVRRVMSRRLKTTVRTDATDLDEAIYGDPHGAWRGRSRRRGA